MRSNTAANIQRDGNTPMNRRTFRSSNRDIVKVSTGSVEELPRAPRIESPDGDCVWRRNARRSSSMPFVCGPLLSALQSAHGSRRREQVFTEMAETWNRLAAEAKSEQTPLQAFPEMELDGPHDDWPKALKLRLGEYA